MKNFLIVGIIAICTMAFSCEKENPGPENFLQYCNAANGVLRTEQTGTILKGNYKGQEFFYLGEPSIQGGYVLCNLPDAYRKDGLGVAYSGYEKEIQYPEGVDPLWGAIEITTIKENDQ